MPGMLEIDHKDGNRDNNALDNLWTLCANCHGSKTHDRAEDRPKALRESISEFRKSQTDDLVDKAASDLLSRAWSRLPSSRVRHPDILAD